MSRAFNPIPAKPAFKTLNQVDTGVTGIRNAQPPTTRFSSSYLIANAQMSRIPISDNNF